MTKYPEVSFDMAAIDGERVVAVQRNNNGTVSVQEVCWQQRPLEQQSAETPDVMSHCVRERGHAGPHSWEGR